MEWAKEFGQWALFLKIDFDKAYDHIDWTFITNMLTFLGFGQCCVGMINTRFTCAYAFVSVNNVLSTRIHLDRSIRKGCPLAPYLYVLMDDALGYLLETTHLQGRLKGIYLPMGEEMIKNHFAYDSLFSVSIDQKSISTARDCLVVFCEASGAIVSDHKTNYWLVGLEDQPTWFPVAWIFFEPRVIV